MYDSWDIFQDREGGSLGEVYTQEGEGGLGDVSGCIGERRQSSVSDMALGVHV